MLKILKSTFLYLYCYQENYFLKRVKGKECIQIENTNKAQIPNRYVVHNMCLVTKCNFSLLEQNTSLKLYLNAFLVSNIVPFPKYCCHVYHISPILLELERRGEISELI